MALIANTGTATSSDGALVYMTGETLTQDCRAFLEFRRSGGNITTAQQAWNASQCYGFVVGILDHFGVMKALAAPPLDNLGSFCIADSVNAHDVTEVVARYLDQHPEKRNVGGYFLTRQALAEKFPCH
jgi:hypothetical protein